MEVNFIQSRISGFAKLDIKYFIPFFTRRFTQEVNNKIYSSINNFDLVLLYHSHANLAFL